MRLRLALAGIAAGTTLLAGCTGDDASADPSPDETSSSSEPAEETTEPDVEAPELPEAATEQSEAGAEAFVRYFVDVFNHMQMTGETQSLADISQAECEPCSAGVEYAETTYDSGGRFTGGELSIGDLEPLPVDYGSDFAFYAVGESSPQVRESGDGTVENYTGGRFQLLAYPAWDDDAWRMRWFRMPQG